MMSEEPDSIEWNSDFYLSHNNFSGVVNETDSHDANTDAGVNYFFERVITEDKKRWKIKIEQIWTRAYFFPNSSWLGSTILGEINLQRLIKHEQGHFDLAEKCARRFERKLKHKFQNKTFSFNKKLVLDPESEVKNQIQIDFEILNEELMQGHVDYDKITNHGLIIAEQEKFNARFEQLRERK
jgi:hypothetical protein